MCNRERHRKRLNKEGLRFDNRFTMAPQMAAEIKVEMQANCNNCMIVVWGNALDQSWKVGRI